MVEFIVTAWMVVAQTSPVRQPTRLDVVADGHHLTVWQKRPLQSRASILLIHGRTWSSLPNWDLQVPGERRSMMDALIESGFDVYALDLRGYGATPRDATGWLTPDRAVADVRVVVDWIRAQPTSARRPLYVLGFSRGALIAAYFAQQFPEKLAGLVLLGFGLDVDARIAASDASPAPPRRRNTTDAAISDFITPDAISRTTLDAFVRGALRADPVCVDWRDEQQFNGFSASKVFVPTLLIHGELDPSAPVPVQAKLFTRLGTSDKAWVVVPGADHVVHLEKSLGYLVRAISWFLRRHDTGSQPTSQSGAPPHTPPSREALRRAAVALAEAGPARSLASFDMAQDAPSIRRGAGTPTPSAAPSL